MQFIHEDPIHVVVSSESPAIVNLKGQTVAPRVRRTYAKFVRGAAPSYAVKVGVELFEFRKIHQGISREKWLSFYDSVEAQGQHGWTDEERENIEARLLERGYVRVEPTKAIMPPGYDKLKVHGQRKIEHVVEKILERIEEGVYDADQVLAFERENLNRPEIISAVEALLSSPEPEPEELLAA